MQSAANSEGQGRSSYSALNAEELIFDAAHFITDHPAKCSNLHGGRYALHVKVSARVDPTTGGVVDYGYRKRLVSERFDHPSKHSSVARLTHSCGGCRQNPWAAQS